MYDKLGVEFWQGRTTILQQYQIKQMDGVSLVNMQNHYFAYRMMTNERDKLISWPEIKVDFRDNMKYGIKSSAETDEGFPFKYAKIGDSRIKGKRIGVNFDF